MPNIASWSRTRVKGVWLEQVLTRIEVVDVGAAQERLACEKARWCDFGPLQLYDQ
jgi:hypothetical protein